MKFIFKNRSVVSALFLSLLWVYPVSVTAQTCNSAVEETTPTSDFTLNNDGTVTHAKTGLTWKVCSEGQTWNSADGSCSGSATAYNWQAALQAVTSLNTQGGYAGHSDWRMPNVKELASIIEFKCYEPSINLDVFKNMANNAYYWSNSPKIGDDAASLGVYFLRGELWSSDRDGNQLFIRLVRGGE
ncbi:DUF1566 domain-containing protein [Thiomicrorhabdus sp.]|uniref:Lcl C-terminal domain-containing protein n=1 Tax=Thiomicrorhabdus sp. TaxID=2039724 RepID=UPI0029C74181|nr:DUF1566 domain-containing protein [Thiomicrorhabdus sp.]